MTYIEHTPVTYQENGIPILNKAQITQIAHSCLSNIEHSITLSPQMIPLKPVLDYFNHTCGLTWQTLSLNFDTKEMIFGICDIKNYCIYIEQELKEKQSLFLFTLAHELGHFVLHRHRKIKLEKHNKLFTDTHKQLKDPSVLRTPLDWIEWQANYFAASLLMPRRAFRNAVYAYLDQSATTLPELIHKDHDKKLISYLQYMFGTSKTSVSIRFNEIFKCEETLVMF